MCKHVCSNKIVYFTISLLAVASLLPADINVALFLTRLFQLSCPAPGPGAGWAPPSFQAANALLSCQSTGVNHQLVFTDCCLPGLFQQQQHCGTGLVTWWCVREVILKNLLWTTSQVSCFFCASDTAVSMAGNF